MTAPNWDEEQVGPQERRQDRGLRREQLAWALAAAALGLLAVGGVFVVGMLWPQSLPPFSAMFDAGPEARIQAGAPVYVPPSDTVDRGFFLVRSAAGIQALVALPAHPRALPIVWVASERRFIDPALGCTFEQDGAYVRGPCPRDLDRYPVTVRSGRIFVDTAHPVRGQALPGSN